MEKENITNELGVLDNYQLVEETFKDGSRMIRAYGEGNRVCAQHLLKVGPFMPLEEVFPGQKIPEILETVYEGEIHSKDKGNGLGLALWRYSELSFVEERKDVMRLIMYMKDDYSEKDLHSLLKYLEENDVEVSVLIQGGLSRVKFLLMKFSKTE